MNMALESNPDAEGIETPQPTEEEWAEACEFSVMELRQVMHDGREARSKLVASNAGLVTQIAKRHYWTLKRSNQDGRGVGTILTMQDLIQEGNLGLMEAAERFDPSKGFRFSTYATWWVRQRVLRSIADYSRVIRLPVHGEFSNPVIRLVSFIFLVDHLSHLASFFFPFHLSLPVLQCIQCLKTLVKQEKR
jgi:DNA-directed RNA polymerase sigma subunit (sigma70/sigma32)